MVFEGNFMTSVKKSFHVYCFVNQDLSFLGGIIVVGVHMYILQMVNGVPTRQIFRPVENSHVFFFCMCCRRREPFLHVVLALQ